MSQSSRLVYACRCGRVSKFPEGARGAKLSCPHCHCKVTISPVTLLEEPRVSFFKSTAFLALSTAILLAGTIPFVLWVLDPKLLQGQAIDQQQVVSPAQEEFRDSLENASEPLVPQLEQQNQKPLQQQQKVFADGVGVVSNQQQVVPKDPVFMTPAERVGQWLGDKPKIEQESVPAQHLQKPKDDTIEISIADLIAAYKNELKGDAQYGGKRLKVTGRGFVWAYQPYPLTDLQQENLAIHWFPRLRQGLHGHLQNNLILSDEKNMLRDVYFVITISGTCRGRQGQPAVSLTECDIVTTPEDFRKQWRVIQKERDEQERSRAEVAENQLRLAKATKPNQAIRSGDIVEVAGSMAEVRVLLKEELSLTINLPGFRKTATCHFKSIYKSDLADLKEGDTVKIRGWSTTSSGLKDSISLQDCILMMDGKWSK